MNKIKLIEIIPSDWPAQLELWIPEHWNAFQQTIHIVKPLKGLANFKNNTQFSGLEITKCTAVRVSQNNLHL